MNCLGVAGRNADMSKSNQGPRKPATKFPHLQKKLRKNAVLKPSAGRAKTAVQGNHRGGK